MPEGVAYENTVLTTHRLAAGEQEATWRTEDGKRHGMVEFMMMDGQVTYLTDAEVRDLRDLFDALVEQLEA